MNARALALSAIIAAALMSPIGPSLADDPTPSPSASATPPADDGVDDCRDIQGSILRQIGNVAADVHEQQQSMVGIDRTIARQQRELRSAYTTINRKDRRIARLEARIRVLRTGLHG